MHAGSRHPSGSSGARRTLETLWFLSGRTMRKRASPKRCEQTLDALASWRAGKVDRDDLIEAALQFSKLRFDRAKLVVADAHAFQRFADIASLLAECRVVGAPCF